MPQELSALAIEVIEDLDQLLNVNSGVQVADAEVRAHA